MPPTPGAPPTASTSCAWPTRPSPTCAAAANKSSPGAIPELERLATTLGRWSEEILNYFDSGLTNGATEGRNLIIKAVKRSGFGFRNFDHYRLRVLYRCS